MVINMINAGKYNRPIGIYQIVPTKDADGFNTDTEVLVLNTYAYVRTTKGFTLITNSTDFEKALTNFTIRYSTTVENAYYNSQVSNRDMIVKFRNKDYIVQYLNNIDEANIEIEMQCKEILK